MAELIRNVAVMFALIMVGLCLGASWRTDFPSEKTIQKIEQRVYEKELGSEVGAMKYKCDKLKGSLVVQSGAAACILNGRDL